MDNDDILSMYKGLWVRQKGLLYTKDYDYKDKFIFKLIMALDDAYIQEVKMRSEIEKLEIQLKAEKKDNWELQKYIINNTRFK